MNMKWSKIKRALCATLALVMLVGISGCKNTPKTTSSAGGGEIPSELAVFAYRSASLTDNMQDYNEVLGFQMMEEATGCHVNWTLPPSSGFDEKFNLMIASTQYPDAIVTGWSDRNPQQYVDDGVIIPLNDLIKENMPNFSKFYDEHPEFAKQFTGDDGQILFIPYIREDSRLNVFLGPQIRTDWLEKLNLDVPETADQLYEVLKAFKTQDPNGNGAEDEIPMTGVGSRNDAFGILSLLWMFNTTANFYVDGNKIKYGVMEPEFEEGMEYVTKLYSEGLIDTDYVLQDRTKMDGKMTNDSAGFMYSYQPTRISNLMAETNPAFKLEGIGHFKNSDGQRMCFLSAYTNNVINTSLAITSSNPNPAGTLKWLDWIWSEEGKMAMNFGREGESYNIVNGEPAFTDLVLKPTEITSSQAFGKYSAVFNSYFPSLQDWRSYSQSLSPYGIQAIETWAADVNTVHALPSLTFTQEEQDTITNALAQIDTYVSEKIDRIILGQESLDTIPAVRAKIQEMGIDKVLGIYQAAFERYNNR